MRTIWRWSWLAGGDVDHDVADDRGGAAESLPPGEWAPGRSRPALVGLLERAGRHEAVAGGLDRPRRERTDARADDAPAAATTAATHRVEVDTEPSGGIEHGRSGRHRPRVPRWRERHPGVSHGLSRRSPPQAPLGRCCRRRRPEHGARRGVGARPLLHRRRRGRGDVRSTTRSSDRGRASRRRP